MCCFQSTLPREGVKKLMKTETKLLKLVIWYGREINIKTPKG